MELFVEKSTIRIRGEAKNINFIVFDQTKICTILLYGREFKKMKLSPVDFLEI